MGIVSRSGTLTYQALYELTQKGIGVTTCVGIGGDPVPGTNFIDCLEAFEADPETKAVILIGEIGGSEEEKAAEFIGSKMTRPVVAYIAGVTAPPGKKMGHAGAIVSGSQGTAQAKMEALRKAGVRVAINPTEAGEMMAEVVAGLPSLGLTRTRGHAARAHPRRGAAAFSRRDAGGAVPPEFGYYTNLRGFGADGDFITSPERHPAFGWLLGRQALDVWEALDRPRPFKILELGAGSGALAEPLLAFPSQERWPLRMPVAQPNAAALVRRAA